MPTTSMTVLDGGSTPEKKKPVTQTTPQAPASTPTAPVGAPSAPSSPSGPTAPASTTSGSSSTLDTSKFGNNGQGTAPVTFDQLKNNPVALQQEIERTKQIIQNRQAAGADTSMQAAWLANISALQMQPSAVQPSMSGPTAPVGNLSNIGSALGGITTAAGAGVAMGAGMSASQPVSAPVSKIPVGGYGDQGPVMAVDPNASMSPSSQNINVADVVKQVQANLGSLMQSAGNDATSQALISKWMEQMSATLAQIEGQVMDRIKQSGNMEDPSVRAAFNELNTQFNDQRKTLLEDMAARGVAQSGIMADLEVRLNKGLLSEKEKLIAGRLSEMETALTNAVMNFANQRMQIMQWGAQSSVSSNMAAMDRQFQAQQTQISALLNLANMGQQQNQFNQNLAFQGQQNQLNRDQALNLQQSQQTWQSGENAANRQWQSGENAANRTWQTNERVGTQEFQAAQNQLNRDFQTFLQQNDQRWQGDQNTMNRDLQRWIQQQQQAYGWSMEQAQQNFQAAQSEIQRSWQAGQNALDRQNQLDLANIRSSSSSGDMTALTSHISSTYFPLLQSGQLTVQQALDRLSTEINTAARNGTPWSTEEMQYAAMMINAFLPGGVGSGAPGGYSPASSSYYQPGQQASKDRRYIP